MDKETPMKRRKGYYSISVVAKMFEVHQQTVRMYEKEGLLTPKRSDGNTRLFSEDDVDRLEEIIYLTHKLGVNLAGVEMILKLKKKMAKLQDEINIMLNAARDNLDEETENFKEDTKIRAQRLLQMKQEAQKNMHEGFVNVQEVVDRVVDAGGKQRTTTNKKTSVNEVHVKATKQSKQMTEQADIVDDWQIEYDNDK
jgi:MerR family transcriptional regulator/heat shock protein HspR